MTFYFGACAGGVWKTTDGGLTWACITDGSFTTAAVGALAVAPSDPNVIYAGTGEACIRNDVSHGDGVYRSRDARQDLDHMWACATPAISARIRVHPHDPNMVYAAALGHAWGPNDERGVFRSAMAARAGAFSSRARARARTTSRWTRLNPRVLYAAIWQAQRYPTCS